MVLTLKRLSNVLSLHKLRLERANVLLQVDNLLQLVLPLVLVLLDLHEQVGPLRPVFVRGVQLCAQIIHLLLQVLILVDKAVLVVVNRVAVSKSCVLPEELLDARNQFQFFLCRQILILVQQQLKLVLKAADQLVKRDLILIVCQLRQFLHRAHCLVAAEHNRIQDLRHDEEVIDLFAKKILDAKVVKNFKLTTFNGDFWRTLTLAPSLVDKQLLIQLLFNLL